MKCIINSFYLKKMPFFLLFSFLITTTTGIAVKKATAIRTLAVPLIDGKLNDDCWEAVPEITGFLQLSSGKPAKQQTRGKILYDDEYLYVGVDADEMQMDMVKQAIASSDEKFRYGNGETIELFLRSNLQTKNFLQVLVNTNGAFEVLTTREMQLSNLGVEAAVDLRSSGFSMEIRIPLAALHLTPDSGKKWGFNLCRARNIIKSEKNLDFIYSSWNHTRGRGFRTPEIFGELEFKELFPSYWVNLKSSLGSAGLELETINRTGKNASFILEANAGNGKKTNMQVNIASGGSSHVNIPLQSSLNYNVDITLKNRVTGRIMYRGGTFLKERLVSSNLQESRKSTPTNERGYAVFASPWMERGNHLTKPNE